MKHAFSLILSLILVLEITNAAVVKRERQSSSSHKYCKPFRAYFVWDRNKIDDNFNVERHYITRVIDNTATGTNICLNVRDGNNIQFIKTDSENVADRMINIKHTLQKDNIISYTTLKDDISKCLQTRAQESFELIFSVNEDTYLDQAELALEELKKIKVFVIYHGPEPVPNIWKSLATDKYHFLHVKNNAECKVLAFLDLMCQDSSLFCDNDMYWTDEKCSPCIDIKSNPCKLLCPYFDKCTPEANELGECTRPCICEDSNSSLTFMKVAVLLNTLISGILLFIQILDFFRKKCKTSCSNFMNPLDTDRYVKAPKKSLSGKNGINHHNVEEEEPHADEPLLKHNERTGNIIQTSEGVRHRKRKSRKERKTIP